MTSPADAPRPGSWLPAEAAAEADLADRLAGVPVAGHVEVLTAEHERLHRLLATIDQL
jgi:hypothetical protein